jgi:NTP pyrophosphatase (non-canonical NTP hydrolase)
MTTKWLLRKDSSMPYQIWNEFQPEEPVEVMNAYGDVRTGFAKDLWWGYETELGEISEGTITKARRLTMMTEHEAVPGTEYYGVEALGEPKGREETNIMKDTGDFYTLEEWEQLVISQEQDEEEMSQWYEFDSYQDWTDTTAIYPLEKGLEYVALGLASEAGEFAGKVKKAIRDNNYDNEGMLAELGDVLWYVARAAAELDVHLSDIAKENVEKLKSRKERGKIGGNGDVR